MTDQPKRIMVHVHLDANTKRLLEQLAVHFGITQTAVIKMLITTEARKQQIK